MRRPTSEISLARVARMTGSVLGTASFIGALLFIGFVAARMGNNGATLLFRNAAILDL